MNGTVVAIVETVAEAVSLLGLLGLGTFLVYKGHTEFSAPLIGVFVATATRSVRAAFGGSAPPTTQGGKSE